ncbi:MerR family transcriptional regulator [Oceanospirillum sanctuarii]|uniref:MerR family transcriptional regulator n=1 Tax=Oceanospirillum sanctuarii TaxID=1434821 RepID=UPI000A38A0F8|nr:MerR family transcriptional regulator [Oceanospirillum sanctuarii]
MTSSPPDNTRLPAYAAADDDPARWLPIREVSERTGVNSVTLRAWERRYGLIKPQRTRKGHRLYCEFDVERIEQIQQWLARGVSVGQVAKLLPPLAEQELASTDATQQQTQTEQPEPDWKPVLDESLTALKDGNLIRFDQTLNQVSAIYPAALLMRFYWQPLLAQLAAEPEGERRQLMLLQLDSYLRNRVGARLMHRNLQAKEQKRLLISHLPGEQPKFELWLAALMCTDLNIPVLLLDELPSWSLLHLIDQQQVLSGVLLLGSEKTAALKQSEQQQLQSLEIPCWIAGPLARIQPELFTDCGWQIAENWPELLSEKRQQF